MTNKISKHISYHEGTYSRTGERLDLDNTPNEEQLKCMKEVAENLFEPLREWVGGPIKINSFFRGEPVNTAIGGSKKSQHCFGEAADIEVPCLSNRDLAEWIKNNLSFDQLILEFYNGKDPRSGWVHVSYKSKEDNRKQVLTINKQGTFQGLI